MKTIVHVLPPHTNVMFDYIVNDTERIHYIRNKPENDKWHQSLGLCGLQMTQMHADTLSSDQIEYFCSRMRGNPVGEPSSSHVNIWLSPEGVRVSIGEQEYLRTYGDRYEFQQWLDEVIL